MARKRLTTAQVILKLREAEVALAQGTDVEAGRGDRADRRSMERASRAIL